MKLDSNNDVYPGDLGILNARKHKWAKGTKKGFEFKIASYVILAAGLVAIINVALRTQDAESSQLPVHLTIWAVAVLTFIAARRGKRMSQDPFNGFHNARFEVSDDTVYYVSKIDGEYKCLPCNVRLIRHIQSDNTNKPSFEALLACKDKSIKLTDSEEYKIGKMLLGEKDNIVWINKIMFNQIWFIDEKEAMTKLYELTK